MIIKTYRFWFLSSLILHVVLLLGVNAMDVPTQAPPEELLVPVKMVPLADPPPLKPLPVVEPVNEPIKATRCNDGAIKSCQGKTGKCIAHDLWAELGSHIYGFLASVTLEDVVEGRVRGRAGMAVAAE